MTAKKTNDQRLDGSLIGGAPDDGSDPSRPDGRKTRTQRDEPLVVTVRRRILEDIITGVMAPSSIIQLAPLATRYGVSRTPVREALTILEREGLITSVPYKGYLVRPIEPGDVYDVYLLRKTIEGAAAELAVQRLTPATIAELASLRPPQTEQMTLEYDDYAHHFHRTIVAAAGSPRLLASFEGIYNDVRRLQYSGIGNPRPDLIQAEHDQILRAITSGDAAETRRLMEEHIMAIQRRALQSWLSISAPE